MKETIIAMRYARALAGVAQDTNQFGKVREDLAQLSDLLDPDSGDISVPEIVDFLNTPVVTQADKIRLTDVICEKLSIGKIVSDFLNVLIKHRRTSVVPAIQRAYDQIAGEITGEHPVYLETARPLDETQRAALEKALARAMGAPVRMTVAVRPNLLGGVRVRVRDYQVDGSFRGRLARLERSL